MQIPDIEALIPQRSPMLFLEAVRAWDRHTICAIGKIAEHWPLVTEQAAPGVCAFEFMTQTVAAHQALCALEAGHPASGIGVVTGCRRLEIKMSKLTVGTKFEVQAEQIWGDGPAGMYQARVTSAGNDVAAARFSVRQLSMSELKPA